MKKRTHYQPIGHPRFSGKHNKTKSRSRLSKTWSTAVMGVGLIVFSGSISGQAVPLGSAADYAIISAAGVTNSGFTTVNGNIALSPTTTIIGFINALPPSGNGFVNGVVRYNDALAQAAQLDARTAYNTLAGTAPGTNMTGIDLGGKTLAPGVYTFNSSAFLTGNLTLATGADQNAVYIFQIGSTLVTSTTSQVLVTGAGVNTPNIFWQVGSSATIQNGTAFSGNILADISITMNTGANLINGRAIALTGAVSLLTNTISAPVALAPSEGRFWNGYSSQLWSGTNWSTTVLATDQVILGTDKAVVFSVTPTPMRQNTILDTNVTISSLTVNDTAAVTIDGANKLTITATGLITGININLGAGLTTINSNLELGLLSQVIDVNNASGMVINGVISGSNGLTKAGTESLTITGVETYTGATVVSEGTLRLGNGVKVGTSIASSNSILVAPTGTLAINLATGETFSQNVTDNGLIRWIAPGTNTQASTSIFSGTGGMQVDSLGTAIILGKNTYTGATVITDGILQLGNGVIAGASIASTSSILVAPDGVLALNLANGETFSQNVTDNGQIRWIAPGTNTQASTSIFSGTGGMQVNSQGTAIILGKNTYTGATVITDGILQLGNGVIVGSSIASTSSILIEPDGVLALNLANNETFSQNVTDNGQIRWIAPGTNTQASTSVFSGTGSMLITAPTRTVLLGDNTFSGGTTVNTPGDVFVGNVSSNTSSPFGSGVLTINNGTIDTVNSQLLQIEVGGYVQTGGEIAMHLEGVEVGDYTRYLVDGSANLSGGTVFVYDQSGNYVPYGGDVQNIINTTDGLVGAFANNFPESSFYNEAFDTTFYYHQGDTLLYPMLTYDDFNANVVWVQDSFVSLPDLTPNQEAVGGGLDGYVAQNPGFPDDVVAFLNGQPLADLPAMYDLIAPDELTAIFQMGFSQAEQQYTNIQRHLQRVRNGGTATTTQSTRSYRDSKGGMSEETVTTTQDNHHWNLFFEATGGSVDVDASPNASGYGFDMEGYVIGADKRLSDTWVVGFFGTYGESDASLVNGGDINAESFSGAIYATYHKDGFFLDASLGAGHNSHDTRRSSLLGYAEGETDGWQLNSMLNAGYEIRNDNWMLIPNASVSYTRVTIDSFTEDGSMTPLNYPSQHQESLRTELGMTLAYEAEFSGFKVTPQVRVAWQHEFMDSTQSMSSRFTSGNSPVFTVNGPQMDRDRVLMSAGLNVQITPNVNLYGYYDRQLGSSGYNSEQVTVGVNIAF